MADKRNHLANGRNTKSRVIDITGKPGARLLFSELLLSADMQSNTDQATVVVDIY